MSKSIGQEIRTTIEELDYNAVCKLTQYVKDSFASIDANDSMKFRIQFNMGEIQLILENFDEFCTTAYGQEIDVVSVQLSNYPHRTYVYIQKFNRDIQRKASLRISCEDIPTLVKMCKGIENSLANDGTLLRIQEQQKAKIAPTTQANVLNTLIPQSKQSNITINVGGDLNMSGSAIGNSNEVESQGNLATTTDKDVVNAESKLSFWEGIWQQIVANGIWWLLGIIGTAIIAYLGFA